MTIEAKFPGKCRKCGEAIQVGEPVEWVKGQGVSHPEGACVAQESPVAAPKKETPEVVGPGVFEKDGAIYLVTKTKDGERLYAKQLREFKLDVPRVLDSGEPVEYDCEWEYVRGVVFDLAESDRMPLDRAKALSIRYGRCLKCGRQLKARESVEAGIGPVCRKSFGGTFTQAASEWADDPAPSEIVGMEYR